MGQRLKEVAGIVCVIGISGEAVSSTGLWPVDGRPVLEEYSPAYAYRAYHSRGPMQQKRGR